MSLLRGFTLNKTWRQSVAKQIGHSTGSPVKLVKLPIALSFENCPPNIRESRYFIDHVALRKLLLDSYKVRWYLKQQQIDHSMAVREYDGIIASLINKFLRPTAPSQQLPPLPIRDALVMNNEGPVGKLLVARRVVEAAVSHTEVTSGHKENLFDCCALLMQSLQKPASYFGNQFVAAAADIKSSNSDARKRKYETICEALTENMAPIWAVAFGKVLSLTSDAAFKMLRKYSNSSLTQPPIAWVRNYLTRVNKTCHAQWGIVPGPGENHPTLVSAPNKHNGDKGGQPLTDVDAISVNIESVLQWHIMEAIANGNDITPYIIDDDSEGASNSGATLQYKITFDTTQTNREDLFMLGCIPHAFPLGGKYTMLKPGEDLKEKTYTQSANNVLVLCLARLDESYQVINEALPKLKEIIERVSEDGLRLPDTYTRVAVEFHLAADLKALWLALKEVQNFGCPFCEASCRQDMNSSVFETNYRIRKIGRELGIGDANIHLCALHAHVRVTERLLKSQITVALQQEKKKKGKSLRALKLFLCKVLKRKKFNIFGKKSEFEAAGVH